MDMIDAEVAAYIRRKRRLWRRDLAILLVLLAAVIPVGILVAAWAAAVLFVLTCVWAGFSNLHESVESGARTIERVVSAYPWQRFPCRYEEHQRSSRRRGEVAHRLVLLDEGGAEAGSFIGKVVHDWATSSAPFPSEVRFAGDLRYGGVAWHPGTGKISRILRTGSHPSAVDPGDKEKARRAGVIKHVKHSNYY